MDQPETPGTCRVALAFDEESLFVTFDSISEPPLMVSATAERAVFMDECVELFWQGSRPHGDYLEFVVSPAGRVYAATVHNPHEDRSRWKLSPWERPPEIVESVAGDPAGAPPSEWRGWRCSLKIPWTMLEPEVSWQKDSGWRGNLFRIARGRSTVYEALSPTGRVSPPDFHVPSRFARFERIDLL